MVDFLKIATRSAKKGIVEVYPKFIVGKSKDLMIRGGDFYAIWLEDRGLWSTDEQDVIDLIDRELLNFTKENKHKFSDDILVTKFMWDSESGIIDIWHKYCQKQMRDSFHTLNEKLIFSNQDSSKSDYASKRLDYPLEEGDISAWEELISFLYAPEERHKIEWCIGSIINGASKKLDKFAVFYGAPGTGKSTVLNIIQKLFEGYYTVFDSKALASSTDSFALEAFKSNPLVAIQHEGDLSKIEDNTRINSLTSHEKMTVNEKHKSLYTMKFISFLFMGSNKVVRITDSKSGILRRLIDIIPTGEKLPRSKYDRLISEIYDNELGAIAWHCKQIFEENPSYYDDYKPTLMMSESNDFYNFMLDSYSVFSREDGTTLKAAWEMYKLYCEEAKVKNIYSMRVFKSELTNYFRHYEERVRIGEDWIRSYYSGFKKKMFLKEDLEGPKTSTSTDVQVINKDSKNQYIIEFKSQPSVLDEYCKNCPAQYANSNELPRKKWDDVQTCLDDLNTKRLHYVKLNDINHIVIDFDLKGPDGQKSFEMNLAEASKWPKTYAELSKSGKGIHLHYIYDGDAMLLDRLYAENIEVKVFTGNSALRRKLTKCNGESINHLADILPKRKEKLMVNFDNIQNEKALRTLIQKNLNKEYHNATKPSVDFIYKNLEDAYNSGMKYDVTDMYDSVVAFAASSTNQAEYCLKLVGKMHFKSDEPSNGLDDNSAELIFLDVEVFPNLFYIGWKKAGPKATHMHWFNPTPKDVESLLKYRIVGFNCRRYDNHMVYARMLGYTEMEIFNLSQKIITSKSRTNTGLFNEAYNVSYADVYDYSEDKKSLKKWEIELGIHHSELGLPWDKPVPKEQWKFVAEYCDYDVDATETVWNHTQDDFQARQMLVNLANLLCPSIRSTVNDTTNQLTGRIIFRGNKAPQSQFLYTNLVTGERTDGYKDPHCFPNYVYHLGKSISLFKDKTNYRNTLLSYRDILKEYSSRETYPNGCFILKEGSIYFNNGDEIVEEPFDASKWVCIGELIGEGGYVWAKPGMYKNIITLDVASMHPHSVIAMKLFGDIYTKNFSDLVDLRLTIKHEDWSKARVMFNGVLESLISEAESSGNSKQLAKALKIAINSVYGLTSAHFDNLFRDPRNMDNIVAKRGALFMHMLKYDLDEWWTTGVEVIHIKTDSIKLANPTPEVIDYVINRGKEFGYSFEVEAKYEKICLVNDAVYIAKCSDDPDNGEEAGKWVATGTQFQVPYVFKTCFSKEPIEFSDLCETKEVKSYIYLNMNEGKPADELNLKFVGKVGLFTPIKPGYGGGELVRESKKKDDAMGYDAVTGTKGYRWLESEEVLQKHLEDAIDKTYYNTLVNEAIDTISMFGDYEWFTETQGLQTEDNLDMLVNI